MNDNGMQMHRERSKERSVNKVVEKMLVCGMPFATEKSTFKGSIKQAKARHKDLINITK